MTNYQRIQDFCVKYTLVYCLFILLSLSLIQTKSVTFPEQKLPSVSKIKDGQSPRDKYLIIRLMNILEHQVARKMGVKERIPWSMRYVFEGDIILQREQALKMVNKNKRRKKRKMDIDVTSLDGIRKWPLPIYYYFDTKLTKEQTTAISEGIQHWESKTCIKFIYDENTSNKKIKFMNDTGCYSYVGNSLSEDEQVISIGQYCLELGIVAHEIGHALGFWHEHARQDRVDHLHVNWDNIIAGYLSNFQFTDWGNINNLGIPYDFGSVMHYKAHQFAKGSHITIETNDPLYQNTIGQRQELSFFDAKLANLVYCADTCNESMLSSPCQNEGYQDPKNCTKCRCPDGLSGDFCQQVAPSNGLCGGTIQLSPNTIATISSVGYPDSYEPNIKCYWLVQSPNGTAINIKFKEPFMNTDCRLCEEDFVEVRFKDNLGITGARFCCQQHIDNLTGPIVSHFNHALILFKTKHHGNGGISADLTIESCGGCYNYVVDTQVTCIRKVTKSCYQTWVRTVKYDDCSMWWPCNSGYRLETYQRLSTCYTEEPYCCEGYIVSSDNHHCLRDQNNNIVTQSTTPSSVTILVDEGHTDSIIESDQETSSGWSAWSDWSTCPTTCGQCHTQTRSRTCLTEPCDGNQTETQTCGDAPCGDNNDLITCSRKVKVSYWCLTGTCYKLADEYYTQSARCCCGYQVVNGVCTPYSR
ncbi:peptidase M12A [Mactra antiquata]